MTIYPPKVSDKYYIRLRNFQNYRPDGTYRFFEVRAIPVELPELPGIDLFLTRGYDETKNKPRQLRGKGWSLREGFTGDYVSATWDHDTKEQAIEAAIKRIVVVAVNVQSVMREFVKTYTEKCSPRYRSLDE